jgi:hypothetical protein
VCVWWWWCGKGAHNDKDAMKGYIVSFSFGATRAFKIYEWCVRRKPLGELIQITSIDVWSSAHLALPSDVLIRCSDRFRP